MTRTQQALRVVAGVLSFANEPKRIWVQQRPAHKVRALQWEFPGGKVEAAESDERALVRELFEELGVESRVLQKVLEHRHTYDDLSIDFGIWRAQIVHGIPTPREGQVLRLCSIEALSTLTFCEADLAVVHLLQNNPHALEF